MLQNGWSRARRTHSWRSYPCYSWAKRSSMYYKQPDISDDPIEAARSWFNDWKFHIFWADLLPIVLQLTTLGKGLSENLDKLEANATKFALDNGLATYVDCKRTPTKEKGLFSLSSMTTLFSFDTDMNNFSCICILIRPIQPPGSIQARWSSEVWFIQGPHWCPCLSWMFYQECIDSINKLYKIIWKM